jgi:hypothetical protein
MEIHEQFNNLGYAVVKSLLDPGAAAFFCRFAQARVAGGAVGSDAQVPGAPAVYGDPIMEKTLRSLLPALERRPAASFSPPILTIGFTGAATPLHEGHEGIFAAKLEPGDGLLYKGTECSHWRDSFDGDSATQVFFHYVDRNGQYAGLQLDKRPDSEHA